MSNNIYTENCADIKLPDEARKIIRQIKKAAESRNEILKKSIPGLYIVGGKGTGASRLAQEYEKILSENEVYAVRGAKTFLEISFPHYGTPADYKNFFEAPLKVSEFQNRFYGVLMIGFEDWTGKELLDSEEFKLLEDFIDKNRDNIYFAFRITDDFHGGDALFNELSNYINIKKIELATLNTQMCADYIIGMMSENKLEFTETAKHDLEKFVDERININSRSFDGYTTLQQISKGLQFEILSRRKTCESNAKVNSRVLAGVIDSVILPDKEAGKNRRIGF